MVWRVQPPRYIQPFKNNWKCSKWTWRCIIQILTLLWDHKLSISRDPKCYVSHVLDINMHSLNIVQYDYNIEIYSTLQKVRHCLVCDIDHNSKKDVGVVVDICVMLCDANIWALSDVHLACRPNNMAQGWAFRSWKSWWMDGWIDQSTLHVVQKKSVGVMEWGRLRPVLRKDDEDQWLYFSS